MRHRGPLTIRESVSRLGLVVAAVLLVVGGLVFLRMPPGAEPAAGLANVIAFQSLRYTLPTDSLLALLRTPGLAAAAGAGVAVRPVDSLSVISIGGVRANLADSTLELDSIAIGPSVSDDEFFALGRYRRDRVKLSVAKIEASGFRFPEFQRNGAVIARRIEVTGLTLDVLSDHRLPRRPDPKPHRILQESVRALKRQFSIDTVIVRNGAITYGERKPGTPGPGRVSFDDVQAILANASNDSTRQTDRTPMVVTARAKFMNAGVLETRWELPLLARKFDMRYSGTLGSMPFEVMNRFTVPNLNARVVSGMVSSVEFSARVTDGFARGTLIPVYHDLEMEFGAGAMRGEGDTGAAKPSLLGRIVNDVMIRNDNPGKKGEVRVGKIGYAWRPRDAFFAYLWLSLKPALLQVIVGAAAKVAN